MRTSIKHSYIIFVLSFTVACSSNKMALNNQNEDNVYVSTARAKEGQPYIRQIIEQSQQAIARDEVRENTYSDANSYTDPYLDDISYTARITRFRNYSPWRNYFDPWYDFGYDPFFYNYSIYQDRFLWRNMPSWSFNLNIGPSYFWNDPFYNPWLFRSPFLRYNYWDMYSFYRPFPYPPYYGGRFGNPWGGPFYPANPRINRPRPGRGSENMNPLDGERIRQSGSRADRYGDSSPSSRTNSGTGSTGTRPSRTQQNNPAPRQPSGNSSGESRPTRTERYNPPSPPASSSRGGDSSSDSKARPSRGGGIR